MKDQEKIQILLSACKEAFAAMGGYSNTLPLGTNMEVFNELKKAIETVEGKHPPKKGR